MQPIFLRSLIVPTLLVVPTLGACNALQREEPTTHAEVAAAPAEAKSAETGDAKKAAAKERKAAKKAHELACSRTELEIAEIETQAAALKATQALDDARRDLDEARRALGHFKTFDTTTQLADGRINFDRAVERKVEAEQELREMEKTYEKDQFAKDTKELVLTRHRKQLEFATRELELSEKRYADLEHEKLPREQRELENKLRAAEQAAERAEIGVHKTELENKVKLDKAHFGIEELQRPDEDDAEAEHAKGGKK